MKKLISLLAVLLLLVCLSAPALAVDAVDSVKVQPAPVVKSATITNPDGSTVTADPTEVVITPADEVTDPAFQEAVDELLTGDLATVTENEGEIRAVLGVGDDSGVVVGGVFSIHVTGAMADALAAGGSITLIIDLSGTPAGIAVKNGSKAVVIHKVGDRWQMESTTVNAADQTATVDGVTSLSPFAVLVPDGGPGAGTSPQTSDGTLALWTAVAILAAAAAMACFSAAGRMGRKKAD